LGLKRAHRRTTSGGNLVFMLVMIGLTIAAVLIAVLHPIQWSVEEIRVRDRGACGGRCC